MQRISDIRNKFLLTGHKFMSEIHLKQPGFETYSAAVPCTLNKEKKRTLKKQEILDIAFKIS